MSSLCQNEPINEALITAARSCPHQVGAVKLSKTQLRVLDSIAQEEEVTAQQIAERCELSSSWSSSLLKAIRSRGYLDRKVWPKASGGIGYSYKKACL
ncbi:MarR family transcriptional regulator [Vibrio cortegadensis]|uniref:MarR family transcriptional regulator n=1 Tax=Vibrio cortegadensis TaxID=1328770 RepID=UPI0021C2A95F|nr:MarR family transcriptional regulator [Vibrio cortegadensis]MDN3696988.1 MarR family transcriptional regulator [Vibrio cortegadensis]